MARFVTTKWKGVPDPLSIYIYTASDGAVGDEGVVGRRHGYAVRVGAVGRRGDGDAVHERLAAPEQGHVLVGAVGQAYPRDP